ncbi:MAG: hypothetical protein IT159_09695, partial [Bryobacterales bacterium]|nr:hypothetical protein [Bryobacterales bacterium]
SLLVDYLQNEEKVEPGEKFYTSGDDRIFPRGLPVGEAKVVRPGRNYKEILLAPSGFRHGVEEVLIVIEGVHQQIPETPPPPQPIKLLPPPPELGSPVPAPAPSSAAQSGTEADRLLDRYRRIGEAQGHTYGTSSGRIPDFNVDPNQIRPRPSPGAAPAAPGATAPGAPAAGAVAPSAPSPTPTPAPTRPPAIQ